MKYLDKQVVFREVPGEISLALSISNCRFRCDECHSPELRDNVGDKLDLKAITSSIAGCTCVLFLGTGNGSENDLRTLNNIAGVVRKMGIKTALYMGENEIPQQISDHMDSWDYVKVGHYDKKRGPLTSKTTNQRMYSVTSKVLYHHKMKEVIYNLTDITYKFWEQEDNN